MTPHVVLLMGVSGSGKSTIGCALAQRLRCRFDDADDFHPPANIARMARGQPLTDADRAPWLASVRRHIEFCLRQKIPAVVACSALKQTYRDQLIRPGEAVLLVYLKVPRQELLRRLHARPGHFFKPDLLESQCSALEEPDSCTIIDGTQSVDAIVQEIVIRQKNE